jgi:hypothetical protein
MNRPLNDVVRERRKELELRTLYERAYSLFLDRLEVASTPKNFPLPYGLAEEVMQANWPHMPFVDHMIAGELTETTNQLNAWGDWLLHLSLWAEVLSEFDEQDAWTIQHSYIDPLAQVCLTQPSATRDRFGHIATDAIHQANLCTVEGYKDHLIQDDRTRPLSREERENQIKIIGARWGKTSAFRQALTSLDTKTYRDATRNYRNLASHAIAPRFRFGITNMVARSIRPVTEMVEQPNGTYVPTPHPSQKCVSYAFGGTEALDLQEVHRLSRQEFDQAVRVFNAYCALLRELLSALPVDEAHQ